MNTTPPTGCKAWQDLSQHAESWRGVHLRKLFAQELTRGAQLVAQAAGLRYDYSRQRMGAVTLRPLYASIVLEAPFLSPKDLLVTPEPDLFLDAWFDLSRLHAGIAQAYTGAHVEQVGGGLYVSTRAPFNPARFDEPLAASLARARRAMAQVVAHG